MTCLLLAVTVVLTAAPRAQAASGRPPSTSSGSAQAGGQQLVPIQWQDRNDALGMRWDIRNNGVISDGTNDCFDGAMALKINGMDFNAQQHMMTADGAEYVLSGALGGLHITRRIRLDAQRSAVRYLEILRNDTKQAKQVQVQIQSMLGSNCNDVRTNENGQGLTSTKAIGFVAVHTSGSRPSVLYIVNGPKAKVRAAPAVHGNRNFNVDYALTIPPGRTMSLVHWVGQRRAGPLADAAPLFQPFFQRKLIDPFVPPKLRRTVVNFRVGGSVETLPLVGLGPDPLQTVADTLNLDRGGADTLTLGEDQHLSGTIEGGPLRIQSALGEATVPLAEVGCFMGGAGKGRAMRVYLRDGEILTGAATAEALRMQSADGINMPLDPGRLHALLMRKDDDHDGQRHESTQGYAVVDTGDRVAVSNPGETTFELLTPWGALTIGLDQVELLRAEPAPYPRYRVEAPEIGKLTGFLGGAEIPFQTRRFGRIAVPARSVLRYERAPERTGLDEKDASANGGSTEEKAKDENGKATKQNGAAATPDKKDGGEAAKDAGPTHMFDTPRASATAADGAIGTPRFLLAADNELRGTFAAKTLKVITSAGATTLATADIVAMRATGEGGLARNFEIDLRKDVRIVGRLEAALLAVRVGGSTLRIPIHQVLEYRLAPATAPDAPPTETKWESEWSQGPEATEAEALVLTEAVIVETESEVLC